LYIAQAYVFIVVIEEDDAVRFLTEHSLGLDAQGKDDRSVGWLTPIAEFIYCFALLSRPLHDSKRARSMVERKKRVMVESRRYCAENASGCELPLLVLEKARVENSNG